MRSNRLTRKQAKHQKYLEELRQEQGRIDPVEHMERLLAEKFKHPWEFAKDVYQTVVAQQEFNMEYEAILAEQRRLDEELEKERKEAKLSKTPIPRVALMKQAKAKLAKKPPEGGLVNYILSWCGRRPVAPVKAEPVVIEDVIEEKAIAPKNRPKKATKTGSARRKKSATVVLKKVTNPDRISEAKRKPVAADTADIISTLIQASAEDKKKNLEPEISVQQDVVIPTLAMETKSDAGTTIENKSEQLQPITLPAYSKDHMIQALLQDPNNLIEFVSEGVLDEVVLNPQLLDPDFKYVYQWIKDNKICDSIDITKVLRSMENRNGGGAQNYRVYFDLGLVNINERVEAFIRSKRGLNPKAAMFVPPSLQVEVKEEVKPSRLSAV